MKLSTFTDQNTLQETGRLTPNPFKSVERLLTGFIKEYKTDGTGLEQTATSAASCL